MAQAPASHAAATPASAGLIFLFIATAMVALSSITMAFSALKLDLKTQLGWDEPTIGRVAMLNNFGVAFVVHMGWLYDRAGTRVTLALAAVLKVVGLLGAAYIVAAKMDCPLFFGACCLVEGQATGAIIIVGQSEVMRHVQPPGKALAVVKTAIGFGPALWGAAYAAWFVPKIEFLYVASAGLLVIFIAVFVAVLPKPTLFADAKRCAVKGGGQTSLRDILRTLDAFAICGTTSTIVWGSTLLWTTNLSTFAVASGYRDSKTAIQSSFFIASGVMRLCVGALLDAVPSVRSETWTTLFAGFMVAASLLMYISDGASIRFAAVLAGGAMGAAATVDPVLCRTVGGPHQATLYSLGKVMGMLWSMVWVRQASIEANFHTAEGEVDCIGPECFRNTWATVAAVSVPALLCTIAWAVRRSRPSWSHEHAE